MKFSTVDFFYLTTKLPDNLLISFQTGSQHNRQGNQIKNITVILEGLPCALDLGVSNGVYYAEAENMKSQNQKEQSCTIFFVFRIVKSQNLMQIGKIK